MKNNLFTILLAFGPLFAFSQRPELPFPSMDLKNEKFSDIKVKLNEYMVKLKEGDFDFRVSRDGYVENTSFSRRLRYWMQDMELHLDERGYVFNYLEKNRLEYLKVIGNGEGMNKSSSSISSGNWHVLPVNQFSPVNWGQGRTNCLAVDPFNADIIYAGAIEGGVWKTADGGASWDCITNHLALPAIGCIAIHPLQSSTLFIFTGARYNNIKYYETGMYSQGIYVTYDGGNNWYRTGLSFNASDKVLSGAIRFSPLNPNVMLAATSVGVFRSADGGASWDTTVTGLFSDLEFKPGTMTCYATDTTGIYKSTDEGQTWSKIPDAAYPLFAPPPVHPCAAEIAVSPSSPGVLYAYYYSDSRATVYKSNNSGGSFSFMNEVWNFDSLQNWYNYALAASPVNSSVVYLGKFSCYRSVNNGLSFNQNVNGLHVDQHEVVALNDTVAFAANDGGVYKTTDGGANWNMISQGINNAAYIGIAGYPGNPNLFFGGTWDNGALLYNNGWLQGVNSGDRGDCLIKPNDTSVKYISVLALTRELYRLNGNNPPVNISPWAGCNCVDQAPFYPHKLYYQNPLNPNTIYTISRMLYTSYNGGTNWNMSPALTTVPMPCMAQGTSDTSRIYVIDQAWVRGTSDYGASWTKSWYHAGPDKTDICVNPANANEAYVALSGYTANEKVFKLTWAGGSSNFTGLNISAGLPNVPVYKLVYQNTASPGLYAGTEIGVFFRSEATGVWEYFGGGLPACRVTDMEINYASNVITAGTYGRGLWQSNLYSGCPVSFNHGNYFFGSFPYAIPPIAGQEYFEASNDIHSSVSIDGGYGVDVTYNAGNFVLLTDSFEVKEGSTFSARTGGCTNPQPVQKLTGDFAGDMPGIKQTGSGIRPLQTSVTLSPNPSGNATNLMFSLEKGEDYSVILYDFSGRLVRKVMDRVSLPSGIHRVAIQTADLENGAYVVRVFSPAEVYNERLIVSH